MSMRSLVIISHSLLILLTYIFSIYSWLVQLHICNFYLIFLNFGFVCFTCFSVLNFMYLFIFCSKCYFTFFLLPLDKLTTFVAVVHDVEAQVINFRYFYFLIHSLMLKICLQALLLLHAINFVVTFKFHLIQNIY